MGLDCVVDSTKVSINHSVFDQCLIVLESDVGVIYIRRIGVNPRRQARGESLAPVDESAELVYSTIPRKRIAPSSCMRSDGSTHLFGTVE